MRKSEIVLVIILVLSAFIILASRIGSTRFLTVLSGSMSPTINMGDLVIVAPTNPQDIKVNDIIAFRDADKKFPVTHRIVNITQQGFITKGDANEDPDARIVKPNEVIGKYSFRVPFAGYFVYYARTKYGFIFLILIPGALLIFSEVRKILAYVKEKKVKTKRKMSKGSISLSMALALSLVLLTSLSLTATKTNAYFSDVEVSKGNTFTAWIEAPPEVIEATIDIDPDTLNLKSEGKFVTVYIELPSSYNVTDINRTTIKMYNTTGSYISALDFPYEIGDYDNDEIQDLMVKFSREEVKTLVPAEVVENKTLTIKGMLFSGIRFEGSDTIKVLPESSESKNSTEHDDPEPVQNETIENNTTQDNSTIENITSANETQSISNSTSFNETENITLNVTDISPLNETDSQNITDNSTSEVEDENSTSETQIINNSTLSNETIDNSTLNETENITTEINITENNSTENSTSENNQTLNNSTEDSYLSNRTEAVLNDSLDEVEDSSQVSNENNSTEVLLSIESVIPFISVGRLSKRKDELLK
jgi:signal peptidase